MLTSAGLGRVALPKPASAEGQLDAVGAFEVAHGVEELAFGDGGVPALCPVAVATLQLANGVARVAKGEEELAGLVGPARKEIMTSLGPPGDRGHRFAGAQDQLRLPLDPEGTHLKRTWEHAQRSQRKSIVSVEPEGASEAFPELPIAEPLVAGAQGEQLLVRVCP